MDYDEDEDFGFGSGLPPAFLLSLTPSSVPSSSRRLSSCFTKPNKPVRAKRQLAWVSLEGRLVGAEEASLSNTIDRNGFLNTEEAVSWEMFTPIQRVLIVAIVSAAAVNSKKNKEILNLQKSVQFRDQVLLSMQEKLDNLCEQVTYFKDQPEVVPQRDVLVTDERGCKLCQHHNLPPPNELSVNTPTKGLYGDDMFQSKMPYSNVAEPEERRMSDLSDWAPSVISSLDIQLDTLAIEHDVDSLLKECEEKDVTIRELSTYLQSSQVLGSKRITELEDIIRRKNMIINKLRKDMLILEQKVVNLTRLRRSSFPAAKSSNVQHFPIMADNVLYDMDSTTGPSSSDSDTPTKNRVEAPNFKREEISAQISKKSSKPDVKCGHVKRIVTLMEKNQGTVRVPLKEKSNQMPTNSVSTSKPNSIVSASGENRSRRRPPAKSKEVATPKRWA